MPSGWGVYYVVFLSALLALGIPAVLALLSHLVSTRRAGGSKPGADAVLSAQQPIELDKSSLGRRMNTRFFLSANASLVLITLGLVLIPCAGILQPETGRAGILRGLIAIVSIAGVAALGLLYSARKGDLNWLNSFRGEDRKA